MIIISVSGCNRNDIDNSEKLYVIKNCKEPIKPYITLCQTEEEKRFSFLPSGISSYVAYGNYQIEDKILTLISEDGKIYVFKIDGTKLIFDEEKSSKITEYKDFCVPTGKTIFELEK